jgi:hypothetical protein
MRKTILTLLQSYFDKNQKDITDKDKLLQEIICLPRHYYTRNMSSFEILKQSGYFKFNNQISNLDILNAINRQPEVVTDWLTWSEDKRTGKGWVFEKVGEKYSVYYYPYKKKQEALIFSNGNEACAAFIKNEIEDIRKS